MLPVGPVFFHGSPYESPSSVAGNPDLLDIEDCVEFVGLSKDKIPQSLNGSASLHHFRAQLGRLFWSRVLQDASLEQEVMAFVSAQPWLEDFALFMALKHAFDERAWWEWPAPYRHRNASALSTFRQDHLEVVQQIYFEQFMFDRQWRYLKTYAEGQGIRLVGDVPIYVAHDSADVWSQPELFTLDETGHCIEVAGVPPDYFSETGQRWGNPLYRWEEHERTGFRWWCQRIEVQRNRFHSLRIDHFRGLEQYWAIPADAPDGRTGVWRPAAGRALLQTLTTRFPELILIAEDLGIITPEVNALRDEFGLPGMKILQFAFDGMPDNPYLPENIVENSVAYTGTHDNDTLMGWCQSAPDHILQNAMQILGCDRQDLSWAMIGACIHSRAKWSIIPLQDILGLGSESRMNTPGTLEGNWQWRFNEQDFNHPGWKQLEDCLARDNRAIESP